SARLVCLLAESLTTHHHAAKFGKKPALVTGAILMSATTEPTRFITDETGNRVAVILDLDRYAELLEAMEELEDIRAFDAAKDAEDEAIPFEQAVREIEQVRQ